MKKLLTLVALCAIFCVQKSHGEQWSALGNGITATQGTNRIWELGGVVYASPDTSMAALSVFQNGQWNTLLVSSEPGAILTLCLRDNTLLIGGQFSDLNGVTCNGLAQYNLATQVVSCIGVGVNYPFESVYKIGFGPDNLLYFCGGFILHDSIGNFARMDFVGNDYTYEDVGGVNVYREYVRDFLFHDNDLYVVGAFNDIFNDLNTYPFGLVNSSNRIENHSDVFIGAAQTIIEHDGNIIFAGTVGDSTTAFMDLFVISCSTTGTLTTLGQITNLSSVGRIESLASWNGDLYIGGFFNVVDGIPSSHIARLHNGVWDDAFGGVAYATLLPPNYPKVHSLFSGSGGLYVAGQFREVGAGISANSVARIFSPTMVAEHEVSSGIITFFYRSGVITASRDVQSMELYSLTGQKVRSVIGKNLSVGNITQGMYVVSAFKDGRKYSQKLWITPLN